MSKKENKKNYFGDEIMTEEKSKKIFKKNKFFNNLYKFKKNVKKNIDGISFYLVPLILSKDGHYFSDYIYDYIDSIAGNKEWYSEKYMYIVIYLDNSGKHINYDKNIMINFSKMSKKEKEIIVNSLNKIFDKRYKWDGTNDESIIITYEKIKNFEKLNIDDLKEQDKLNELNIVIKYKKSLDMKIINSHLDEILNYLDYLNYIDNNKKYFKKYKYEYGSLDITINIINYKEDLIEEFRSKLEKKISDIVGNKLKKIKFQI
jgi:hypothetical protein